MSVQSHAQSSKKNPKKPEKFEFISSRLYKFELSGGRKIRSNYRVSIVGSSSSLTKFSHFLCGKYLCIFKDVFEALVEKGCVKNMKIHSSLNSNLLL